ncbi:MAG TPA: hypothetical protein VIY54_00095 [Steroidobacteraceae bacterium]
MPIAAADCGTEPVAADPAARAFYMRTMQALNAAAMPYLVGGGFALAHYTAVPRQTHDFDIFVRRGDYAQVMSTLAAAGYHTELTFPHWLGKATCEHGCVDVIFSSGNGVSSVDDGWFRSAPAAEIFGIAVRLCPVEEMIWSKAFVMERERYDCADIMHLLLTCADALDWTHLLERFGPHWRVLFTHLCLFGFVYPGERNRIPKHVMRALTGRLDRELRDEPPAECICNGTLLSREQYLTDVQHWGFRDARHTDASRMTPEDVVLWTEAIGDASPRK